MNDMQVHGEPGLPARDASVHALQVYELQRAFVDEALEVR